MKRLLKMLLILCLVYILVQLGFKYLGNGHHVNYEIKGNDYTVVVDEIATYHRKQEIDHYYFTFKVNNQEFYLQTYETFKKNDHVVEDIKYLKTNAYECIYPVFKNREVVTDILCKKDNIIYHYHDLQQKSGELVKFAKDMKEFGYEENHFQDNIENQEKDESGPIVIYPDNLVKHHYLGVDNYSGIYLINNYVDNRNMYKIELFGKDSYERVIDARAGRYYIVADYSSTYDFDTFYIVDLVYNDKKTIKYHSKISFDSYIQGSIDHTIYLFDRNSKKQYKIDCKNRTMVEIGNEQLGIQYYNRGKWETKKITEASASNLYFNEYQVDMDGYERVDLVGTETSGFYYYYKKNGTQYEVYRANAKNKDRLTYLFNTSNINEIEYLRDYVYFKEGNTIKYYQDAKGIRTVLANSEFEFNSSLHYYTYYTTK